MAKKDDFVNGPQKRKYSRVVTSVYPASFCESLGISYRNRGETGDRIDECPVCLLPNLGSVRSFSEHIDVHMKQILHQIPDKSFQELINSHFIHQMRIRSFTESLETEDVLAIPLQETFPINSHSN